MFLRTNYLFAGSICVGNPYRSASALDIPWAVSLEVGAGILVAAGVGLGVATCVTLDARAPQAARNNAVRAIANPLRNAERCAIGSRIPFVRLCRLTIRYAANSPYNKSIRYIILFHSLSRS